MCNRWLQGFLMDKLVMLSTQWYQLATQFPCHSLQRWQVNVHFKSIQHPTEVMSIRAFSAYESTSKSFFNRTLTLKIGIIVLGRSLRYGKCLLKVIHMKITFMSYSLYKNSNDEVLNFVMLLLSLFYMRNALILHKKRKTWLFPSQHPTFSLLGSLFSSGVPQVG